MNDQPPIVFYDGECGVCNRFVQFALARDPKGSLRFAPLQGTTAKGLVGEGLDLSTILFWEDRQIYRRSDAIFAILQKLKNPWPLLTIFRWVPRPIRDYFYNLFAKYRHKILGKNATCRIPTAEERSRFLS